MGEEHLDPAWTFGPEGERFEVEVTGDPRAASRPSTDWHPELDRGRPRPQPRHRRHRHPLRQRRSLRLRRRARHAAPTSTCRSSPAAPPRELRPRPGPLVILDRFRLDGSGGRGHRCGAGHRPRDRHRSGPGRCRCRAGRPHRVGPGGRGRAGARRRTARAGRAHRRDDQAELEHLVAATVDEFGRLDIVVNNAGGAMPRAALDTSEGFLERAFHFNVTAAVHAHQTGRPPDGRHGRSAVPWSTSPRARPA